MMAENLLGKRDFSVYSKVKDSLLQSILTDMKENELSIDDLGLVAGGNKPEEKDKTNN